MSSAGLWMLTTLAVLVIATGMPAGALLIGTSSLFGLAGVLTGQVDPALLGALPGRLVGLLENDLLQALPQCVLSHRVAINRRLMRDQTTRHLRAAGEKGQVRHPDPLPPEFVLALSIQRQAARKEPLAS